MSLKYLSLLDLFTVNGFKKMRMWNCMEIFSKIVICSLPLVLFFIYKYLTRNYNYWYKRQIPFKKAEFPFGSLKEIVLAQTFGGKGHENIYKQFPNERFYGIIEFQEPCIVLRDPELIKNVLVKDVQYFIDRSVIFINHKEYIRQHLFHLKGQEWKDSRKKLSPTFTSGKMKRMFELLEKYTDQLKDKLETDIGNGKNIVDVKDLFARFALDITVSCTFGLDSNSLNRKDAEIFSTIEDFMKGNSVSYAKRIFFTSFPNLIKIFDVSTSRPAIRDFLTKLVQDTIEYRRKNNVWRNDFLDILRNINHNRTGYNENNNSEFTNHSTEGFTIKQMAAHSIMFLAAGYEPASSLIAFCLYELSRHKDIQEKLYQEIQETIDMNEGKISYQVLMKLPFLDQVINETLRRYGTGQNLSRVCMQHYKIPDSDLVLEKGLKVTIPLYAIHHDPKYYPDPYAFKPERFTPEEVKKRHPYTFMPFSEGPRNCIGKRFGLMQAKIGLITVISNFQFELSPEQEVPIEINKKSAVLMPAKPVLLKFSKRIRN